VAIGLGPAKKQGRAACKSKVSTVGFVTLSLFAMSLAPPMLPEVTAGQGDDRWAKPVKKEGLRVGIENLSDFERFSFGEGTRALPGQ
jgi:hypothetical protein